MGVHGLWRLIEPSGKPVPVESLENKILAVDVSIWLHQAIKGFQDAKGAPALNDHLLGIFHRVCKLLYFKIKPIFVFDGGVPVLKRETIAKRNKLKHKNISEADKIQKQLLDTLIKHSAVSKVLGEKAKNELASVSSSKQEKTGDDLFKLPKAEEKSEKSDEEDSSESDNGSPTKHWNLHNIDTRSEHFKSLPADVRHEILTELKETRKQSSWGRLHELPTQSDDFSGFQMQRLLKRQEVQLALEEAEKEMGGHSLSLAELEEILKDQGVISKNIMGNRIASDENTRYLYIRDVKQALEKARREEEKKKMKAIKEECEENDLKVEEDENIKASKADLELESDIQKAIALSLQEQPSGSGYVNKKKLSDFSFLENFEDEDFESSSAEESSHITKNSKLTSAQNYMMEYSGLTPNEIAKIIASNEKNQPKKRKLVSILEDETKKSEINRRSKSDEVLVEKSEESNSKKIKLTHINECSEVLAERDNSSHSQELRDSNISCESESIKGGFKLNVISGDKKDMEISNPTRNEETDVTENETISPKVNCIETEKKEMIEENINSTEDKIAKVDISAGFTSGSEESENDFEEVEELSLVPEEKNMMEIKIEAKEFIEEDDLFADIFIPKNEKNEFQKEETILEKSTETIANEEKVVGKEEDNKKLVNKDEQEEPKQKDDLLEDLMNKVEEIKSKESGEKHQVEDWQVPKSADKLKLTENDLKTLRDDLNKEELELRNEQGLRERLGTNITDQMYQEAQDLLELFGLPYVVAPMEAEAQCAFLESASLTDGTITDDSDIWLFGGKTVYKNFFNQSKHVLEYRAEDIKHHFKLTREQMILLALLVGSDYTTGLQGVGPVTAMEILANFPPSSTSSFTLSHNQLLMGLNEFKSWFMGGKSVARTKNSLRNKLKNVTFTEGFPSMQVVQAYLNPTVDQSEEQFTWSKPDIVALIDFGRSKFGWSKIKTEEILKPVIKRMKESKYQSTLLNYFKIKHDLNAEEAQKLMSERVRSAVKRIGQDPKDIEDSDDSEELKNVKKRKKSDCDKDKKKTTSVKRKAKKNESTKGILSDDEFIEIDQIEALLETVEKENETNKSRKGRKKKVVKPSKLLGQTEAGNALENKDGIESNENKFDEKTEEKISPEVKASVGSKDEKNSISILENEEMNLLIKVLSNQEPSTSKNATKIARVKKIAEKIEKVKNPESNEEQGSTSINRKITKKLEKNEQKGSVEDLEAATTSRKESNIMKLKRIARKLEGKNVVTLEEKMRPKRKVKSKTLKPADNIDEELKVLKETEDFSIKRVEDIKAEAEKIIEKELNKKKLIERKIHRKEIIPQKERAQKNLVNNRLRAIEVFRKSKIDPSTKKGAAHKSRPPKEDADLSESSSDSDL
ncbi:DNA excision repair protein ERCC-5 homolog [Coccinella septempunctata]|uniref:DNA excision repair protein ERCC-5 homolog n=1 Tax=Coccinella septempunctata TaxID=41139 RepID=UPI001D087CC8|nr:DNA excision repair protein ERCC-5 homolog [Coccinella septempunctata]